MTSFFARKRFVVLEAGNCIFWCQEMAKIARKMFVKLTPKRCAKELAK